MPRKKDYKYNLADCCIEFFLGEWNNHYTVNLLLFEFWVGLRKFFRCVEYNAKERFSDFVQSSVYTISEGMRFQFLVEWLAIKCYYLKALLVTRSGIAVDTQNLNILMVKIRTVASDRKSLDAWDV